jgi:hypothetical protein
LWGTSAFNLTSPVLHSGAASATFKIDFKVGWARQRYLSDRRVSGS